jgi:hypothetical protein
MAMGPSVRPNSPTIRNSAIAVALLAATTCAAAGPKRPGGAIQQAEAEARAYLPACTEKDDGRQQLCLITERNFVEQYVYAKAGDVVAMGSTAASFDENAESEEFKKDPAYNGGAGRPFNAVQTCAWRMVIVDQPVPPHGRIDVELADIACRQLSDAGRAKAMFRAREVEREIGQHITPMPPEDWEPTMLGLRDP